MTRLIFFLSFRSQNPAEDDKVLDKQIKAPPDAYQGELLVHTRPLLQTARAHARLVVLLLVVQWNPYIGTTVGTEGSGPIGGVVLLEGLKSH